jgi:hypothetical protein
MLLPEKRSRATEKTGRRKDILATEFHGKRQKQRHEKDRQKKRHKIRHGKDRQKKRHFSHGRTRNFTE